MTDELANLRNDDPRLTGSGRVQAFSDGVFAIIITLLVLDLTVPEHRPGGLAGALASQWPKYAAFAVSFLYIGVLWLNHHAMFRNVSRVDIRFQWLNLALLFGTVVIPFPTAVIASTYAESDGDPADQRIAVLVYSLLAALMSLTWLGVWIYLSRHHELLRAGVHPGWARAQLSRPVVGIVLYAVSGLAGYFIATWIGLLGITAMIVYHALTSEGIRRRKRA